MGTTRAENQQLLRGHFGAEFSYLDNTPERITLTRPQTKSIAATNAQRDIELDIAVLPTPITLPSFAPASAFGVIYTLEIRNV